MTTNPWLGFFDQDQYPQAAYYGYQNQFGRSPNQKRYFQGLFQDVQNQYMGALGQQIYGGGAPTLNFTDYLSQFFAPGGGAAQQWAGMSPTARGESTARFAPPVRFMPFGQRGFGGF